MTPNYYGKRETNMSTSSSQNPRRSRLARSIATVTSVAILALAGTFAVMSIAAPSPSMTIGAASSPRLGETVLVSSQGRTLYALSPETTKHLLCTSSSCLKFWPPLTVASRDTSLKAGMGVKGRLGILRRRNGALQITYAGMPLYRFAGDRAKGEANGEGLHSFGGTWHVLATSHTAGTTPTTPAPATTPATGAPATTQPGSNGYESTTTDTTGTSNAATTPASPAKPVEEKHEPSSTSTESPAW
jgi:predicted lipoprotein with Yx(FWY)xxD motif